MTLSGTMVTNGNHYRFHSHPHFNSCDALCKFKFPASNLRDGASWAFQPLRFRVCPFIRTLIPDFDCSFTGLTVAHTLAESFPSQRQIVVSATNFPTASEISPMRSSRRSVGWPFSVRLGSDLVAIHLLPFNAPFLRSIKLLQPPC